MTFSLLIKAVEAAIPHLRESQSHGAWDCANDLMRYSKMYVEAVNIYDQHAKTNRPPGPVEEHRLVYELLAILSVDGRAIGLDGPDQIMLASRLFRARVEALAQHQDPQTREATRLMSAMLVAAMVLKTNTKEELLERFASHD